MIENAVVVNDLVFRYKKGPVEKGPVVLDHVSLSIPKGSTCLIVGANGSGKSTLLKAIGGVHMIQPSNSVLVHDREAFCDLKLNGIRQILQTNWATHSVAFAGYNVPLTGDFMVSEMHKDWQDMYPERRAELIKVLGIDLTWRMHMVSDGQRRRIQLFIKMLKPFEVLLLDEVLSVLDVLCRRNVLNYLKKETVERGCTVIYVTHIFDGLYGWPSHMVYLKKGGTIGYAGVLSTECIPDLDIIMKEHRPSPLLSLVESWLTAEEEKEIHEKESGDVAMMAQNGLMDAQNKAGGYTSGRML